MGEMTLIGAYVTLSFHAWGPFSAVAAFFSDHRFIWNSYERISSTLM